MSSRQQRLGRVAVNSTLAVILVLMAMLPPFVGAPATNVAAIAAAPAAQQPAALQAAETTYYVEWNITASGYEEIQGSDYRTVTERKIKIIGDAVYHEPAQGRASAIPMKLTITDDMYQNTRGRCTDDYEWRSITDPGRYTGGPDPFWSMSGVFWPHQAPDGTWSMDNPFVDWTFVANGELLRYFNYRTDQKHHDSCGSHNDTHTYTNEMAYYSSILRALKDMPLRGDPSGTVFRLINTSYTVETGDGPTLTVIFNATVRVVRASCKGLAAPIDIANPALKFVDLNLQAEDMTPDGEATLQARVTCQGVPVLNAPVVVALKAMERSGGHNHVDGKRPRGYIDGVEQNANSKFIGITDSDGAVTFAIRPGRDLTDKSRGIAGLYVADAKVEWEGLTSPTKRAYINAHLDLVPLPKNDQLYITYPNIYKVHPEEFYGTPVTVGGIQELAKDWIAEQNLHNWSLSSKGKDPWPIRKLMIYAISLPEGGLFDLRAWLGSNYMWRTPFRQHRTGEDVWFRSSFYDEPIEQHLWYERAFRDLGNEYGTWFSDAGEPSNLKITRASANLLESSMSALSKSASTNPDVAASAVLVNPEGRFVAGAGQTVTYTVGVENVVSGTQASQVALKAALPAGLSFIRANPTQSRMQDSRTPVWDIGSLPDEGAPRTFDVIARVDPSTAAGTLLSITATATTSSLDADPANNQFSDWGLTVQQPGPDLVIGSDLNATALVVGEPVTFTIRLSNEGNAPASNSWLNLTAPTGITITKTGPTANVIPNGVRWNAGVLAPGGWQTFTVGLLVDPGLLDLATLGPDVEPKYPLSFLMTAGSGSTDIDPASNQMQVDKRVELPGPDLLVALQAEGTPGPGVFQVGQQITYTLRYANLGNREAGGASAALLLWPGLTLMASQPAPSTNQFDTTSGVRTLTWNLGELSAGEEGTIELRLRVDNVPELGSIIRANISSNNIDLNSADNVVMETRYKAYASNAGRYKIYLPLVKRR